MTIDVSTLSAAQLLALTKPEQIYPADLQSAKATFKRLSQIWHPDKNPSDVNVFAHIKTLFEVFEEKHASGIWESDKVVHFTGKNIQIELQYLSKHQSSGTTTYVGKKNIIIVLPKEHAELLTITKARINEFKFSSIRMEGEFKRVLPTISMDFETSNFFGLVIPKPPEMLLIRDVMNHFGGKVEPKHAAWMISRLYNIACYLNHIKVVHTEITPDTCFVNLAQHTVSLLGGWWFTKSYGKKLTHVSDRSIKILQKQQIEKPDASILTEQVRAMGRELLGDFGGSKLLLDTAIPKPLVTWLRGIGSNDVVSEYDTWMSKILPASFGERRFVVFPLTSDELYTTLPTDSTLKE